VGAVAVALSPKNGLDKSLSPENEYTGGRLLLLLDRMLIDINIIMKNMQAST